jgi:hypothetical protein
MKKMFFLLCVVLLVLPLQIPAQDTQSGYLEDFNAPVDLDMWSPNKLQYDENTLVFTVTQEEDALKVVMKQLNFPDGQHYNFGLTFDLDAYPAVSVQLKLEEGALYAGEVVESIPFSMSPWSFTEEDTIRQHSNITFDVPADDVWEEYVFDWSEDDEDQETYPNDYSNITKFLLETVVWPDTHEGTFWIDDFLVGIAPPNAIEPEMKNGLPVHYALSQNFPNPFNPVTNIYYTLPKAGHVMLEVYDISGQEVNILVNETQAAGQHHVTFDAKDLASGVYIIHMKANRFNAYKRMTLVK